MIFSGKRNFIFPDNTRNIIYQRHFFVKTIFSKHLEKENMAFCEVMNHPSGVQLVEPVWGEKSHSKSPNLLCTIEAPVSSCCSKLYLPDMTSLLFKDWLYCCWRKRMFNRARKTAWIVDIRCPKTLSIVKLTLVGSDTNLNIIISFFGVSLLEERYSFLWSYLNRRIIVSPYIWTFSAVLPIKSILSR